MGWDEIRKLNEKRMNRISENYKRKLREEKMRKKSEGIRRKPRIMKLPANAGKSGGRSVPRYAGASSGELWASVPSSSSGVPKNKIEDLFKTLEKELGYIEPITHKDGKIERDVDKRYYHTPMTSPTEFLKQAKAKRIPTMKGDIANGNLKKYAEDPRNRPTNIRSIEENMRNQFGWKPNEHVIFNDYHIKLPTTNVIDIVRELAGRIHQQEKYSGKKTIKTDTGELEYAHKYSTATEKLIKNMKERLEIFDINYNEIRDSLVSDEPYGTKFVKSSINPIETSYHKNIKNPDEFYKFLVETAFRKDEHIKKRNKLQKKAETVNLTKDETQQLNDIENEIKKLYGDITKIKVGTNHAINYLRNDKNAYLKGEINAKHFVDSLSNKIHGWVKPIGGDIPEDMLKTAIIKLSKNLGITDEKFANIEKEIGFVPLHKEPEFDEDYVKFYEDNPDKPVRDENEKKHFNEAMRRKKEDTPKKKIMGEELIKATRKVRKDADFYDESDEEDDLEYVDVSKDKDPYDESDEEDDDNITKHA